MRRLGSVLNLLEALRRECQLVLQFMADCTQRLYDLGIMIDKANLNRLAFLYFNPHFEVLEK
jgi:hypothetical protein